MARPAMISAPRMWSVSRAYSTKDNGLEKSDVEKRIIAVMQSFDKDLNLDSLDTVEVLVAIEEEFNIEIPDNNADEIKSIDQAVEYILAQSEDHEETAATASSVSAEINTSATPAKKEEEVEKKKHIVVQQPADSDVSDPESDDSYNIDQDENLLNDFPRDTEEIELLHLKIQSIAALGFENFPKVKSVCLRQNLVTSLEGLEDLPETLEELDLYDNRISHVGSHLKHFKNITSLDLSFNKIRHLKNFEHLKDLEKLYICQNKISAIENISDFSKLTYLELGANRIRKIEGLEKLVNLEQLWLGKNKITKLEGLETLTKLRILSIQSNRIVKLEGLEALTNLEEFYISHNGIEKIEGLDKNLALNIIDISSNRIEHIENLSHLINLQELWASGNRFEDFDEIKNELNGIKSLEAVYFEFNPLQRKNPVTYHNKIRLSLGPSLKQIDANYIK